MNDILGNLGKHITSIQVTKLIKLLHNTKAFL